MRMYQRGNTYHFRMRIPADLVEVFEQKEIYQSLRTSNARRAASNARAIEGIIAGGFESLRLARLSGSTTKELRTLARGVLQKLSGRRCPTGSSSDISESHRLDHLISLYLAEKEEVVDPRTYMAMRYSYRLARHHLGNIRLDEMNRAACRHYREALRATPQYLLRDDGCPTQSEALLSDKSVNKHLQYLSALLRWGVREELVPGNPAEGLSIQKRQRDWEERSAYDDMQLQTLLGCLWTDETKVERRWVPLVALYSGMRLEEICQLRARDIIEVEGVHCFQVTSEAGSLKTAAAERLVPVHPKLLDLGLLGLLPTGGVSPDDRLWPNLTLNRFGRYSNGVGRWFSRYKRRRGFAESRYCFHSLRHTFINRAKQTEIPEPIIRQLVGHREASITLGRYGKHYEVKTLNRYLTELEFELRLELPRAPGRQPNLIDTPFGDI